MFTGIITEIGKIGNIAKTPYGARLVLSCCEIKKDLKLGESIAVNGVCLSAIGEVKERISFDVVANTFNKTNLKRLKPGDFVNLEKALKLGDTLSGHILSGHVDCERKIKNIRKHPNGWILDISVLADDKRYIVNKGSIAVDGISLTIADVYPDYFRVYLIPHTMENTTLKHKRVGDHVNIEFDMFSKYAEKKVKQETITRDFLARRGFM